MSKSNSLLEMEMQILNHPIDFYNDSQSNSKSLDISSISLFKLTNFSYLCNGCTAIPVIKFFKNGKMRYICNCDESPRDLFINDVYNLLYYSEGKEKRNFLNCENHPDEKYIFYCKIHNINLCPKCLKKCLDHIDEKEIFIFDESTFNKSKYLESKNNSDENVNNKDSYFENDITYAPNIIKLKNKNQEVINIENNNIENDINDDKKSEKNNIEIC